MSLVDGGALADPLLKACSLFFVSCSWMLNQGVKTSKPGALLPQAKVTIRLHFPLFLFLFSRLSWHADRPSLCHERLLQLRYGQGAQKYVCSENGIV